MASSLLEPMRAIAERRSLESFTPISWYEGASVSTVVAAAGYPGEVATGDTMTIPPDTDDVTIFHAGTKREADGSIVTSAGRVVAVTALAPTIAAAQELSAAVAAQVRFKGAQFRRDIGWRELARAR
jgi:phosphoribosylamine-glycine ligase